jgi:Protein of unknown function (DUF2829)
LVLDREEEIFMEELFGIGKAVKEMLDGRRVRRIGWNGNVKWIALQVPEWHSKMTDPYVYMCTTQGGVIPWSCSQADLLATDWTCWEGVQDSR